jgi:hypothetical protein
MSRSSTQGSPLRVLKQATTMEVLWIRPLATTPLHIDGSTTVTLVPELQARLHDLVEGGT